MALAMLISAALIVQSLDAAIAAHSSSCRDRAQSFEIRDRVIPDAAPRPSPELLLFDFRGDVSHDRGMLELLMVIGRALALALRGHRELVLENLALRQQLTAVKRTTKRPHLHTRDRLFWIALARSWRN
jgi:hypothetical protein